MGANQWSYSLDKEDEENTPTIKKNNFVDTEEQKYSSKPVASDREPKEYELKSLTREQADSTFTSKNSSVGMGLGPHSNTRSTMMGGTSYNFAYSPNYSSKIDHEPKFIRKSDMS